MMEGEKALSVEERRLIIQAVNMLFAGGHVKGTVVEVGRVCQLGMSIINKMQQQVSEIPDSTDEDKAEFNRRDS
jgi:prepilin-type processing-associated H-X9-DG protein